jgi:ubiquinone/menaquinone biosynthesis C-methylase UbiE
MIGKMMTKPSDGTFTSPEKLPRSDEERKDWQNANKSFWENNSMRYDWDQPIEGVEFSDAFYKEIDNRFFGAIKAVMPWRETPFEQWLDFKGLRDKDVLEIGVGNGSHAQLISPWTRSYTGIDLTNYAVKSTSGRIVLYGIPAQIIQMDAEKMEFPNSSFDLVWSWGVIHHSSNTDGILDEIRRVLRVGGKATIMVYYRGWFSYYLSGFLHGVFKGYFFRGKSLHQTVQIRTDGALARYYTFESWRKLVNDRFEVLRIETMGNKADVLPMPGSRIKSALLRLIPNSVGTFLIRNLRMGTFLICEMQKKK